MLMFELSMPNSGSWNGRWSGEGQNYIVIRKVPIKQQKKLDGKYFHYDFGDGWCAGVSVTKINAKEAAKQRRKSNGFAGYDWMIDEILKYGHILTLQEREKIESKQ